MVIQGRVAYSSLAVRIACYTLGSLVLVPPTNSR